MHPAVSLLAENAFRYQHLFAPVLFLVVAAVASVHGPVQHSLLVASVSWAIIWIPTVVRTRPWSRDGSRSRKTASWLAGGFLALAQLCDRAACDKEGSWSLKAFLPLFAVLISENDFFARPVAASAHLPLDDSPADDAPDSKSPARPFALLVIAIAAAAAVLASRFNTSPTSALGVSSVIFAATGLVFFESALRTSPDDGDSGKRGLMSANGTFKRRTTNRGAQKEQQLASLRDVALVMAIICGIGAFWIEPRIAPNAITWEPLYRELDGDWKTMHYHQTVRQVLLMICINVLTNVSLFVVLLQQGAVHISFLSTFSYLCASLNLATSFSGIWFAIIYGSAALLFLFSSAFSTVDTRFSTRFRRIFVGIAALSFGLLFLRYVSGAGMPIFTTHGPITFDVISPERPLAPTPIDLTKGHPAAQLINSAEKEFQDMVNRQSKSLGEAVQEYRRRNGVAPPPHFDEWYKFAARNGVVLIDEFDTINQSLLPFWAVNPSTIRNRIKAALGHEDSALMGLMIRNGNVVNINNVGPEWQQQATTGMMKQFIQYLPDMDLGFNIHDEPRVVVPNAQLSAMVAKAQDKAIPAAMKNQSPRNSFSARPSDMNDGKRFEEAKTSRFNRFAHQQTWTHARLSCPADSQASQFEDVVADNLTTYATGPLNHVYNQTAFSDICNSPSLSSRFGFFERPNAFSIIHELTPVFSQSKISSFQDILYPSPWYWFGKVAYDADHDTTWENKTNSLYWRGSTTGGFSRNGGWRRQHRQHIVRRLNALENTNILTPSAPPPSYALSSTPRKSLAHLIDVKFSHVGQCDPGDCAAQKEFFDVVERVDGQDAWYFKHLLDMDGNAFSGRFYAFLRSRSLTFKMALFREWHAEWLRPWVHFVPLTLGGDEHLDLVAWFGGVDGNEESGGGGGKEEEKRGEKGELPKAKTNAKTDAKTDAETKAKGGNGASLGETKARDMAQRSTEWAAKVLRNVDFEVWFFRLLLEYGRVIDDDRDKIGYAGP
ncbi:hypothetical protein BDV95DRAFT_278068 [Massariosphaeria phaeospora]|uniref:Glycosyl transferase CAP10 domain-containing protein n=1 Tax=Massariosphaeria phaeospora TaxID=100035 RepID=A0A7C8IL75_9PLEO|nr:hypothetical protein BDV95DRAFT_278068 [Massariosphaeria phaeospora]